VKRFPKILLSVGALLLIYALSSGPAVYWVRCPVVTGRTLEAFDRYDRRLNAYFCVYFPIVWLRNTSSGAESALACYERLFQPDYYPSQA
jgi:hypothetical protein